MADDQGTVSRGEYYAGERLWVLVDRSEGADGCWWWLGTKDRDGYGTFSGRPAHRVCWENALGLKLPPDLELDHECRNRACVNPAHLEPVDHATNTLRSTNPAALNARKTCCPAGHPLDGVRGDGRRYCKTCERERSRTRRAARAADASST